MRKWLHSVYDAVSEHGLQGLVGLVPGGTIVYMIAGKLWQMYRERRKEAKLRADCEADARKVVQEVVGAAGVSRRTAVKTADRDSAEGFGPRRRQREQLTPWDIPVWVWPTLAGCGLLFVCAGGFSGMVWIASRLPQKPTVAEPRTQQPPESRPTPTNFVPDREVVTPTIANNPRPVTKSSKPYYPPLPPPPAPSVPAPTTPKNDLATSPADEATENMLVCAALVMAGDAARYEWELRLNQETARAIATDLKAKEPEDRVKALNKLAALGTAAKSVGEQVIEAMQDKEPAVQNAARRALGEINPTVFPHVVAILSKPSAAPNKREAIAALGSLGERAAITVPLLLKCNENVFLWGGGNPKAGKYYDDLLPVVAKIASKDERFTAIVLGYIAAPNTNRDRTLRERRLAAVAQLDALDIPTAEKVTALVRALEDGQGVLPVIASLERYRADARPAVPTLAKLKQSSDKTLRAAAITALAAIE